MHLNLEAVAAFAIECSHRALMRLGGNLASGLSNPGVASSNLELFCSRLSSSKHGAVL
jgi:hypothetical protein